MFDPYGLFSVSLPRLCCTPKDPPHGRVYCLQQVIEVVSGDCVVVADDAAPEGSPAAERRINLSSIRAPKVGNPRRDEKPAPHAREAKEFLRSRLIGQKVSGSLGS
jgi:endonuclease YncB( thermonuclease family)